jgi:hypothetical protein
VSDLQCPARFIVLTTVDAGTADLLAGERVAGVYDGKPHGPGETEDASGVDVLAGRLGLGVQRTEAPVVLEELRARTPSALQVLTGLADLHRGETVLVHGTGAEGTRLDVLVDADDVVVTG